MFATNDLWANVTKLLMPLLSGFFFIFIFYFWEGEIFITRSNDNNLKET